MKIIEAVLAANASGVEAGGVWCVVCGVVVCGVWSVECGVWSVECGGV